MIAGPLPPDVEDFVQESIAAGKYRSADELVIDAIRLLREHDQDLELLRRKIDLGLQQVERGEVIEIPDSAAADAFFAELSREGHERLRSRRANP